MIYIDANGKLTDGEFVINELWEIDGEIYFAK